MSARKITERDPIIDQLLADPNWRVTPTGKVLTRIPKSGSRAPGRWRRAGWVSPSRGGQKLYRRVQYRGVEIYEHRIVYRALKGPLSPFLTVNHRNLNGTRNAPGNLELLTPGMNTKHAWAAYRRLGMSAAEARANWAKGNRTGFIWRGIGGAHKR